MENMGVRSAEGIWAIILLLFAAWATRERR